MAMTSRITNLGILIQCRTNSTRLPGKALLPIQGKHSFRYAYYRSLLSRYASHVVVLTSDSPSDNQLCEICEFYKIPYLRGSLDDVLDRFHIAAQTLKLDHIVRITADCPLVDPVEIDRLIHFYIEHNLDYASNSFDNPNSVQDGLDVEIFSFTSLSQAAISSTNPSDREHVTSWIQRNPNLFTIGYLSADQPQPFRPLSLDTATDYAFLCHLFSLFHHDPSKVVIGDIVHTLDKHSNLFSNYPAPMRNLSYHLQLLEEELSLELPQIRETSEQFIPSGSHLLSKTPRLYHPELWPSHFICAKGSTLTASDGQQYLDCATMGVGTNILGYNDELVNSYVTSVINKSTMSSLNCPEEVLLARKLVSLHPWSSQAKFARSGGEANAIAIRIARAYTGKEDVAICGYHGWHDWYLASNLTSHSNLNDHLLPNLDTYGVPASLAGTTLPFKYNDLERLQSILSSGRIAAVKMEVQRNIIPTPNFLQQVRDLCNHHNALLIFDECTSGFRETLGGLHLKYNVDPDIAVFGKALGNGFPITAVLGSHNVMKASLASFISSTFWTDRVGPAAALATLYRMEQLSSWKTITEIGNSVSNILKDASRKFDVPITTFGLPSLLSFEFLAPYPPVTMQLYTQYMLDHKILACSSFYSSVSHTPDVLDRFSAAVNAVFHQLSHDFTTGDISSNIIGPLSSAKLPRLN